MEAERPKHLMDIENIYSQLEPTMTPLRSYTISLANLSDSVIKAAFIKCFEFNRLITQTYTSDYAYFQMATLRSICEDLIVLSYLNSLDASERQSYLEFQTIFEIHKSLLTQEDFFKANNPGQIIVDPTMILPSQRIDFVKNKPTNRNTALNQGYKVLPSVFSMADSVGYTELYKYLYYATSSLVHFRPDILLKMGWSDNDEESTQGKFSVKNFSHYYLKFNIIYGSLLFIEQTSRFNQSLNLDAVILDRANELRQLLSDIDWPELTTFEHLNIKPPSSIIRVLVRAGVKAKERD